jgi:hypothetical protein
MCYDLGDESKIHAHSLSIVELGMWRPARVVDVGLIPVRYITTDGGDDCNESKEDASKRTHIESI